mgnify:CR=1 FL=1
MKQNIPRIHKSKTCFHQEPLLKLKLLFYLSLFLLSLLYIFFKRSDNLKAIIFDMDGVIIDSEPLHFELERELLEEFGGKVSRE